MFFTIPSNMSNDAAAYWARQFEACSAFNAKTLNSMAKLADLNIHALQGAVSRSSEPASQQAQMAIDAAREYTRHVAEIACEMRAEYSHLMQGNIASASDRIDARLGELAKNAPDSASGVIDVLRATLGNVHKGYDQLVMTSDQAAQAMVDSLDVRAQPFAH